MISNLQIISGKYRGRKLALPPVARPTQNRARIALFNMLGGLGANMRPYTVWDAFAGSGAFGLECISRFDADVVFTDTSPESIKTIKKNLGDIKATIIQTDAISVISRFGGTSDLVFIDPPYAQHELAFAFVRKLTPVAKSGTILVWESDVDISAPDGWTMLRDKTYGRARFLILQKT